MPYLIKKSAFIFEKESAAALDSEAAEAYSMQLDTLFINRSNFKLYFEPY